MNFISKYPHIALIYFCHITPSINYFLFFHASSPSTFIITPIYFQDLLRLINFHI